MTPATQAPAKNLLRPRQVQEGREELRRIDEMLNAPPHIRTKISDPRGMASRKQRLKAELEEFTPKPFTESERTGARRLFEGLQEEIAVGMPSSEEMRRNPPGAVQKHQAWEKRNKKKVLKWKEIGLRLQASGDLDDTLGEAAINVELLRKHSTGYDLSLDGAQIPRKTDYHMPAQPDSVVLSDEQVATLEEIEPDLAKQLALLSPAVRSQVKQALQKFMAESAEPAAPAPAKPPKKALPPAMQRVLDLQKLCKEHGINSFRMKVGAMAAALAAKGVTVE